MSTNDVDVDGNFYDERKLDLYGHRHDAGAFRIARPAGKGQSQILPIECFVRAVVWEFDILHNVILLYTFDRDVRFGNDQPGLEWRCVGEIM